MALDGEEAREIVARPKRDPQDWAALNMAIDAWVDGYEHALRVHGLDRPHPRELREFALAELAGQSARAEREIMLARHAVGLPNRPSSTPRRRRPQT